MLALVIRELTAALPLPAIETGDAIAAGKRESNACCSDSKVPSVAATPASLRTTSALLTMPG